MAAMDHDFPDMMDEQESLVHSADSADPFPRRGPAEIIFLSSLDSDFHGGGLLCTQRLHSSSFLGFIFRIL